MNVSQLVVFGLSVIFGIIIGIILLEKNEYHGPDSNLIRRITYYDEKNDRCVKFVPYPIKC